MNNLQVKEAAVDVNVKPLVSVIITNYNYGRFVAEAIDSVLNQTYSPIELIVVDDGSSDNSREVIESYGDRLIPIIQANTGMGGARCNGFAASRGEIICFLDADDYFHPEKVEKVVAAFQANPEWIQVSHLWTSVNKDGNKIGSTTSDRLSQGNVQTLLLRWGKYASGIGSALGYRRSAIERAMPLRGELGMDTYLNATLPFYGEVGRIQEYLMFYRMHGNNIRAHSDNMSRLIRQREAIAEFINDSASKNGLSERFDLTGDPEYMAFKMIEQGGGSVFDGLRIIWLTFREGLDIGRSPKDMLIRLLSNTLSVFPGQGILVLRYGLRGYVRFRLTGQKPTH